MLRETIATIILVSLNAGCGGAHDPAPIDDLVLKKFEIGHYLLSARVPQHAKITRTHPDSAFVTIHYHWGYRNGRPLVLHEDSRFGEFSDTIEMQTGAQLSYSIVLPESSGMGGPEAYLEGVLAFGESEISVSCREQDGSSNPDPTWCIAYLHHVYLAPIEGPGVQD